MEACKSIVKVGTGFEVFIYQDDDSEDPRGQWDNATTFVCFHGRYNLGDKHEYRQEDYEGWEGLEAQLDKDFAIVQPLFLYDHSGLTVSTSPFNCPWDSGQIGFACVTAENLAREWSGDEDKAREYLECDVATYDQYLRGEVYSFVVKNADGEVVDSCSSFYGYEYACKEAEEALDYAVEAATRREREVEELVSRHYAL